MAKRVEIIVTQSHQTKLSATIKGLDSRMALVGVLVERQEQMYQQCEKLRRYGGDPGQLAVLTSLRASKEQQIFYAMKEFVIYYDSALRWLKGPEAVDSVMQPHEANAFESLGDIVNAFKKEFGGL